MRKLKRPDILFLLTGLLLLIPCLVFRNRTLDINVHDTYFVIALSHIGVVLFLIHCLYALAYFIIRRFNASALGILHLILSTPFFVYIILTAFFYMGGVPRRYYTNGDSNPFATFWDSLYVVTVLFILAQFLFLINIIVSIVKAIRLRKRN